MSAPMEVFKAPIQGISLVEASAGTGKTYTITSLYVRTLLEKGLNPADVLVMTFTEAATAELKLRLRNRLKDALKAVKENNPGDDEFLAKLLNQKYPNAAEKLKNAIDSFDEAAVFTIHGFCTRLLTEHNLQFGVPAKFDLLTDESELLQDVVDDYWRTFISKAKEDEQRYFLLDFLTDEGFGPDELKSALLKVLNHPHSKVVPENLSTVELFDLAKDWKTKFEEAKSVWEEEKQEFKEVYFHGDLDGNVFKKKMRQPDWEILQEWLNQTHPSLVIPDRLFRFGSYMEVKGSKKSYQVPHFEFFEIIDDFIELAEQLKMLKPAFIKESIEEIRGEFRFKKDHLNYVSYNDLLTLVGEGFRSDDSGKLAARISEKYPVALVDEFQDTDPVQYGIFRRIYEGRTKAALFMIGDPKQAIYGFRGADIFTYFDAREDVTNNQSYHLGDNYRSNGLLIEGVNELFSTSTNPFLIEDLSFQRVQFPARKEDVKYLTGKEGKKIQPLQFKLIDPGKPSPKNGITDDLYEGVCNEISELLSGGYHMAGKEVSEKHIAVLVRSGYQGEEIQARLRERGIQSVLKSRTSVFATQEAEEFFRVLGAIHKASYEPGIKSALATELIGYSADQILELSEDEAKWSAMIERFVSVKETWEKRGLESAFEQLLQDFEIQEQLVSGKNAERRITNVLHLSELLAKAQREHQYFGKALLKWFYEQLHKEKSDSEDEELRLESDEDLVQISTIHSSKGLQYPIVFCPFLWEDTTKPSSPDKADIFSFYKDNAIHIDVSKGLNHPQKQEYLDLSLKQEMAEEVRLAYVALTRAISACYVFVPNYKSIKWSPLASILQTPQTRPDYDLITSLLESFEHVEVSHPKEKVIAKLSNNTAEVETLSSRTFRRDDVYHYPRMLSYSALAEGKKHDEPGRNYDEMYEEWKPQKPSKNKFGFPKGANAGTCLHKIFEDISFNSPNDLEEAVRNNLEYYGFAENWLQPVKEWIFEVLHHSLGESQPPLSSLREEDVLKEMEFFFPVQNIKAEELWKIIRKEGPKSSSPEQVSGFMKGFIDLIFRVGDTYYILDYKSNHLGDELTDYEHTKLSEAMKDAGYDLQYHIYTLALHRFLKHRMEGYGYEQHFGGVMYLFLRGVDTKVRGSGVFFDKPDFTLIEQLDSYVQRGGHS